ncbi:hypothetical protein GOP47_0002354 [Adiantum capillus-veneris]|uniref:F-box domain-containing protein n=1 Tax=Adiantum capillus-veneris TaxID=13818 RepID=A0A9D4VBE8_ADICA|nr:hypothetical protein GOP47_0002354 [Adiantum capillus-veneris]
MEEILARGFAASLRLGNARRASVQREAAIATTCVGDLPDECLASVFLYLSSEDRHAVALTCRRWRSLEALSRHTLRFVCQAHKPVDEADFLHRCLMHALQVFPHILHITMHHFTRLPDSFFTLFQTKCFAQLSSLRLHFCLAITDKSVDYVLAGCPALTHLTLTLCTEISDVSLHAIACGLPSLEYLDISYCKTVTDVGIDDVLKSCPNMQDILFSYCFEVEGWGLRNGKNLKKVQAEACILTDAGLIEGLRGATSIEIFNMADLRSGFRLGARGLGQVGIASKHMEVLCLRMCRMLEDATVKEIAKGCPNLRVWDLSRCQEITFDGWQAVAQFCAKLQYLDVNRCRQFCDRSILAIQKSCPTLLCIHVTSCPSLTDESCRCFEGARPNVRVDTKGALTNCCHIT